MCIRDRAGDLVFCSSLTFAATVNPVVYQDGIPVFIDSDRKTWNMSPAALERAFQIYEAKGKLPKAVIVVHLYGMSAEMEPICQICRRYGVPIIEDCLLYTSAFPGQGAFVPESASFKDGRERREPRRSSTLILQLTHTMVPSGIMALQHTHRSTIT